MQVPRATTTVGAVTRDVDAVQRQVPEGDAEQDERGHVAGVGAGAEPVERRTGRGPVPAAGVDESRVAVVEVGAPADRYELAATEVPADLAVIDARRPQVRTEPDTVVREGSVHAATEPVPHPHRARSGPSRSRSRPPPPAPHGFRTRRTGPDLCGGARTCAAVPGDRTGCDDGAGPGGAVAD